MIMDILASVPLTSRALADSVDSKTFQFIDSALQETDRRYHEQNSLNRGFLLAVYFAAVQRHFCDHPNKRFNSALRHAIEEVLKQQMEVLVIPHRLTGMMRSIWLLQFYLVKPRGQRVYRTLFHRYFRAAFDFWNCG